MAVAERSAQVSAAASRKPRERGRLIAVDGVNGVALTEAARASIADLPRDKRGVSWWDASGVFGDLIVADREAGRPSARTLLLLYAADLAFRLRWEIRPALAEGRVVVAAPYVATAIAFGRAAGLPEAWLTDLFTFAPRAAKTEAVDAAGRQKTDDGFVEFGSAYMIEPRGKKQGDLLDRTRTHLRRLTRKRSSRS
jgi:hypothetical protein